jgi:hypothetical protein
MRFSPLEGGFSFSRKTLLHGVRKWEARIYEPCSAYKEDKSIMFQTAFTCNLQKTLDKENLFALYLMTLPVSQHYIALNKWKITY